MPLFKSPFFHIIAYWIAYWIAPVIPLWKNSTCYSLVEEQTTPREAPDSFRDKNPTALKTSTRPLPREAPKVPRDAQMHPREAAFKRRTQPLHRLAPNNCILGNQHPHTLHPTTAYFAPNRSRIHTPKCFIDMHPKSAYMHPRVSAYMHPNLCFVNLFVLWSGTYLEVFLRHLGVQGTPELN